MSASSVKIDAERVLVVPSSVFDALGRFQGFHDQADRYLEAFLVPEQARFLARSLAEDDPSFKQIIPYVVFRAGNQIFCYTRGSSQGEARLRRRRSLGVGGHVNEADADGRTTLAAYETAVQRELEEEVEIGSRGTMRCLGLINDDSTPVGSVHLGVVHLYELDQSLISPREDGLIETGFVPIPELRAEWDLFESWSQICIQSFLDPR